MKSRLFAAVFVLLVFAFLSAVSIPAHAAGGPGYALFFNDSANYVTVPHTNAPAVPQRFYRLRWP